MFKLQGTVPHSQMITPV